MKKCSVFLLLLITGVLLAGCSSLRSKPAVCPKVELLTGQWVQLPKPSQLAFNVVATQILTAEYKAFNHSHNNTSQVQVEKTPQRLVLIALAGWGGELFSINYDGAKIKTSSLSIPNLSIGLKHVLTDFILTYASAAEVENLLKTTEIQVVFKPHQRIFILHDKPVIKIDYENIDPWKGTVVLHNFKYNYSIKIVTVAADMKNVQLVR